MSDTQSLIVCLQETRLPGGQTPYCPRGFSLYEKSGRSDDGGAPTSSGGVSVLVRNCVAHSFLPLVTDLQAVAVRCHLNALYSVCSLYLPPPLNITTADLENLISQLPAPFLLLGDFNARSPLWGDSVTNAKGRVIETLLLHNPYSILNTDAPTHFHTQTDSLSCIDLSLCSSDIIGNIQWTALDDLYNSDHYPILLTIADASPRLIPPKYIFDKADWTKFKRLAVLDHNLSPPTIEAYNTYITNQIIQAANSSIPKTKGVIRSRSVPWWNADLEEARRQKLHCLRQYRRSKLLPDKLAFKRARAHMRYLLKRSRHSSWVDYVSSLTESTPINTVWKRVQKVMGKFVDARRPVLDVGTGTISDPKDVADCLASSLSDISTGSQNPEFLRIKQASPSIHFPPDNAAEYNIPLTLAELQNALKLTGNSAAGEDQIHYQLISHLSDTSLSCLLHLFNRIWLEHQFPSAWSTAIVLPFLKPGKDHLNPTSYRPIALTSCLCKLLERMINIRLVWYLEEHGYLHSHQYGFRKNRSTTDTLVYIDSLIKSAFAHRQHLVAIFFDLQKAYDTTWKSHILQKLFHYKLTGHLPIFIQNFLSNRTFQVRIGNSLSNPFPQVEGVPQGCVLSCTLFAIAINDLPSCMPQYVDTSLYVDDFAIFAKSSHLPSAERRCQLAANRAHKWASNHGFTFSSSKTVCMHFHRVRGAFPPLSLTLNNSEIPQVNSTKFLGLYLDPKLTYIPHLKYLRIKCMKTLNLLKCLSRLSWGADRVTLLRIYRALIRSQLDYGCQIYNSASATSLKMLDPVHHQGLRLAIGAFRTSPMESLYSEAGEPSLSFRRDKLSLQLYARLLAMPDTPAHSAATSRTLDNILAMRRSLPSTFSCRVRDLIASLDIAPLQIIPALSYHTPPYTKQLQPFCPGICNLTKSSLPPPALLALFNEHRAAHQDSHSVFTDGSKTDAGVGFSVVQHNSTISRSLPPQCSIYTAELRAILTAVSSLIRSPYHHYTIYSDSRSALTAVCDSFSPHPLVVEIHRWLSMLHSTDKLVEFCWVPSHVGVRENEEADRAARDAANSGRNPPPIPVPHKDFYPVFKTALSSRWNAHWSTLHNNKLRQIKPHVNPLATSTRKSRAQEVTLARLRIGHTRKTHAYLLAGNPPPYCDGCLVPLSVMHILSECPEYGEERMRHYGAVTVPLCQMLADHEPAVLKLFAFLRGINWLECTTW